MGDRVLKRMIQPNLRRGPVAERAALLLLLLLLAVLAYSVVQGVFTLAS